MTIFAFPVTAQEEIADEDIDQTLRNLALIGNRG
ncbi:MAG: hypothetical protein XD92_1021 [Proteiniphilum acetatigenes]|jgi:hypothetical protein|uniref:Uncharacterized protein n=1 Tax=Proteiniphilum acetatigenes TaxID=294710 RepID=A0A101HHA1_9BACT|nr:MAG: hypothetical protein XD92_1021 [Proteiniphilum acetatigenes]